MNKRIAISVITVLAVGVSAGGYFVVQQSNKLGEAGSEIVALEDNVSALEENVSTLEENGSVLEVKLTDLEAKVSALEADLDKANDDVELQQKLVGQGAYVDVLMPNGTIYDMGTSFTFTNPGCVGEITIDRISIFRFDGRVVYEGPLLKWREEIPWTEPMKPHETRSSELEQYVSGFEWPPEAPDVWMNFTVEIFWSGAKEGLPLTGWVSGAIIKRDSAGHLIEIELAGTSQMLNMEQALESEDKD